MVNMFDDSFVEDYRKLRKMDLEERTNYKTDISKKLTEILVDFEKRLLKLENKK